MRQTKKLLSLLLAIMMVFCLSVGAMAEGGDTAPDTEAGTTPTAKKTITLSGGKAGHTYNLYQIFTGTVVSGELTNVQWGTGIKDDFKATKTTAAAYAKEIADGNDARATAQSLITANALQNPSSNPLIVDGDVVFSNLDQGYYIITDTNTNENVVEGDYSSAVIVKVVEDINGALKAAKPTSQKKVDDRNDSTDADNDEPAWEDSADYDIGDSVPFQLKAKTASNVSAYKKYHITFQDKQSAGLDAPTSYKVKVFNKTLTLSSASVGTKVEESTTNTKITAEVVTPDAGQTFAVKVTFEPIAPATTLNNECVSTDILVEYDSVLNANAEIGSKGNPNTSYIKYSSNPESSDDSEEGKTPEDKVIVFTYKTVIDKIDSEGNALAGAEFTLYKVKSNYTIPTGAATEQNAAIAADTTNVIGAPHVMTVSTDKTSFSFTGLDDGTYVLCETKTPEGFNTMNPILVTVSATHDVEAKEPALLTFTATEPFSATKDTGSVDKKDGTKHSTVSGEAYAEIENNSGSTLPQTGGMGTTLLYVGGVVLVAAAAILLVFKKRLSVEK